MVNYLPQKMMFFVALREINWCSLINMCPNQYHYGNMCIVIICCPVCGVIKFKCERTFLIMRGFFAQSKSQGKKVSISRTKRDFNVKLN